MSRMILRRPMRDRLARLIREPDGFRLSVDTTNQEARRRAAHGAMRRI